MKVIFHFDADAFYVSCSQLNKPETIGLPVVVSSQSKRHSIISSASYEARKYGIKAAMTLQRARELCPKLQVLEADYELYEKISKQIINILKIKYTDIIECSSIDEGWMDVSNIWKYYGTAHSLAQDLQKTIHKELGITISIGISYTKWLAKMASNLNKPQGITSIGPKSIKDKIWHLPIEKFYGIGKKSYESLKEGGINTIGDISKIETDQQLSFNLFKKSGNKYLNLIYGNSSDVVNNRKLRNKDISAGRTFLYNLTSNIEIRAHLKYLCSRVSEAANIAGKVGLVVGVSFRNDAFTDKSKQRKLRIPIQSQEEIYREAIFLLESFWNGEDIRFMSVRISDTRRIDTWTYQQSFFDLPKENTEKLPV